MTHNVQVDGHQIEIWASRWSGKERISYDGRIVSEKRSLVFTTIHSFEAIEEGNKVTYEVVVTSGLFNFGYGIRRNGIIQAHKP